MKIKFPSHSTLKGVTTTAERGDGDDEEGKGGDDGEIPSLEMMVDAHSEDQGEYVAMDAPKENKIIELSHKVLDKTTSLVVSSASKLQGGKQKILEKFVSLRLSLWMQAHSLHVFTMFLFFNPDM